MGEIGALHSEDRPLQLPVVAEARGVKREEGALDVGSAPSEIHEQIFQKQPGRDQLPGYDGPLARSSAWRRSTPSRTPKKL